MHVPKPPKTSRPVSRNPLKSSEPVHTITYKGMWKVTIQATDLTSVPEKRFYTLH